MSKIIEIQHPGDIDGTPYEVSTQSIQTVASLVATAASMLRESDTMLLNAELQRALDFGNDDQLPGIASKWIDRAHPQARMVDAIIKELEEGIIALANLKRASSYDPKHPPTEASA